MKIIFSGGGTLGPVSPLLAIYEQYRLHNADCEFVWVGTKIGPERDLVESYSIPFFTITSGKFRRYITLFNVIDFFKIIIGFFQSIILLWQEKPSLLISAGGFVSVPLHFASFVLGIPTWVHQQDNRVGLANKMMSWTASKITVALQKSIKDFPKKNVEWIGNPVRDLTVKNINESYKKFGFNKNQKVILAFGGGTGSSKINQLIIDSLPHLNKDWQIIHLTGKERNSQKSQGAQKTFLNYHPFKFFTSEMKDAYAISDVIIGRGGFVTITEVASLQKPAILLPIPDTHQEENVKMLAENRAAVILDQNKVNGMDLAHIIKEILDKPEVGQYLGRQLKKILPPIDKDKLIEIIEKIAEK